MSFEKPNLEPNLETRIFKGAQILYISYPAGVALKNIDFSKIDYSNCVLFETKNNPDQIAQIWIRRSFMSDKIKFEYSEGKYMDEAKVVALRDSLDENMPNASVIVKDDTIIGFGANGSNYHKEHGCERVRLGIPTGQGYELCEGCSPKNHGEQTALKDVYEKNNQDKLQGSTLYMYGHWWCCKDCNLLMEKEGIKKVVIGKTWAANFLGIE